MTGPRLAVPVLLAALLAVASGCGGDDSAAPHPTSTTASAPAAPALQDATPALGDLTVASCPSGDGRQQAGGTLVNHGRKAADFVVTVRWLGDDGSVVGSASTVLEDVASKQTGTWQVAATLRHAAASCTTQASRGRLPS